MIKKPVNFGIGLICAACFFINIANHRDASTLVIAAIAAVVNIMIGLCE